MTFLYLQGSRVAAAIVGSIVGLRADEIAKAAEQYAEKSGEIAQVLNVLTKIAVQSCIISIIQYNNVMFLFTVYNIIILYIKTFVVVSSHVSIL